jgi:hypothetical protein
VKVETTAKVTREETNMKKQSSICIMLVLGGALLGAPLVGAGESPVTLEKGTPVQLRWLHHLHSKYNPIGSEAFLEVADDVIVDGRVVIPKGRTVRGRVRGATRSRTMGRAGSISFSAKSIVAVDGTEVLLSSRFTAHGRDRAESVGRMSAAFGLAGLLAKGRMAYLEKASRFTATVSEDQEIGAAFVQSQEPLHGSTVVPTSGVVKGGTRTLAIEKGRTLAPIHVLVEAPAQPRLRRDDLREMSLIRVNDVELPEPVKAVSVDHYTRDKDRDGFVEYDVTFDGWNVLRYCGDGRSELVFRGPLQDGSTLETSAVLHLSIKKK